MSSNLQKSTHNEVVTVTTKLITKKQSPPQAAPRQIQADKEKPSSTITVRSLLDSKQRNEKWKILQKSVIKRKHPLYFQLKIDKSEIRTNTQDNPLT